MPNVKPGDLAKLIYDAEFPTNVGAQFLVKEEYRLRPGQTLILKGNIMEPRKMWLLNPLQPVRAFIHGGPKMGIVWPGQEFFTFDSWLRRIDPPANDENLYTEDKLPREEILERCALIDKHIKEATK